MARNYSSDEDAEENPIRPRPSSKRGLKYSSTETPSPPTSGNKRMKLHEAQSPSPMVSPPAPERMINTTSLSPLAPSSRFSTIHSLSEEPIPAGIQRDLLPAQLSQAALAQSPAARSAGSVHSTFSTPSGAMGSVHGSMPAAASSVPAVHGWQTPPPQSLPDSCQVLEVFEPSGDVRDKCRDAIYQIQESSTSADHEDVVQIENAIKARENELHDIDLLINNMEKTCTTAIDQLRERRNMLKDKIFDALDRDVEAAKICQRLANERTEMSKAVNKQKELFLGVIESISNDIFKSEEGKNA